MAAKYPTLEAAARTEFGKGAARRLRRNWQIPVVIYGPETDPIHIAVHLLDFTSIVRNEGVNAVIEIDLEGEKHLTMVKHLDQNVLSMDIDHADLLAIKRGEKVEVEVPVVVEGEPEPGTMYIQEADSILIEVDVLNIPEELTVSVEGLEHGSQITASDVPVGDATLTDDPELLVVNVVYPEPEEPEESEEAAAETDAGAAPGEGDNKE